MVLMIVVVVSVAAGLAMAAARLARRRANREQMAARLVSLRCEVVPRVPVVSEMCVY
jgi:hypothetical protein